MCGIFGFYHLDGQSVDLPALERATTLLRHRGPDDEGYLLVNVTEGKTLPCGGIDTDPRLNLPHIKSLYDQNVQLAFGFRRLSIIDLSPQGHQPMAWADGRYWIIYNGEIYNYLELRAELAQLGYRFKTASDTEVILAAFQQWGINCFNRFNGMWAIAIWDNQEKRLVLSRDRFGIKPLYFTWRQNRFCFASEIKALMGGGATAFTPNPEPIYRFLKTGHMPYAHTQQTFFNGVNNMPPAHVLMIDASGLTLQRYWSLPPAYQDGGRSFGEVLKDFSELFEDAMRIHLRSDVAVGSCLSGGLDSSAIVMSVNQLMSQKGLSNEQIGDHLRTFSAVYDEEGPYNELKYIDSVLRQTSIQKNLVVPSAQMLEEEAAKLVWFQDEPFPSTSIFAQWCVMKLARERQVTVLLDGQGADELMGGYRPFSKYLADFIRQKRLWDGLKATSEIYHTSGPIAGYYLAAAFAYALLFLEPLAMKLQYSLEADRNSIQPEFFRQFRGTDWRSKAVYPHSLDEHLRQIFSDTNLPDLLRYEDRNSMAFSIEARVPYLDYRLVEFIFCKAAPWRIFNGWTKYILRKAVEGRIPDEITWRKDKIGFATPEKVWIRDWMRSTNMAFLQDGALSGEYIKLNSARERIAQWLTKGGRMPPVWRWINLEIWLQQWKKY